MGSLSDKFPVVQHKDLICVPDGSGTLGNDKHERLLLHPCNGASERRVCGEVQGGCAVIQYKDLRLSDKRPGNGQTLFLPAGQIAPALFHRIGQSSFFFLYKF